MPFEESKPETEPQDQDAPDAAPEANFYYWENGKLVPGMKPRSADEAPKVSEPVELRRNDDTPSNDNDHWNPEPPQYFVKENGSLRESSEQEFIDRNAEARRKQGLIEKSDSIDSLQDVLKSLDTIETEDGIPYSAAEIIAKITDVRDEINNATTPEQVNAAQELLQTITNTLGIRDKVKELLSDTFEKKEIEIASNSIAA